MNVGPASALDAAQPRPVATAMQTAASSAHWQCFNIFLFPTNARAASSVQRLPPPRRSPEHDQAGKRRQKKRARFGNGGRGGRRRLPRTGTRALGCVSAAPLTRLRPIGFDHCVSPRLAHLNPLAPPTPLLS